ncbi:MAG: quinolinate synthase NadA [Desulfohalobiaceae bacterium]|nr:quinolinate synthase NadA [Desulfohalobiaceae bacterium]MCF8086208.1 quinolinate synthase NadA [Desulfohalobiaceae bacterium]
MADYPERIQAIKERMGQRLHILAHHYQSDQVVRHADSVGDSLELARRIPSLEAEHIVMCGVFFMAETASVLARQGQGVYLPAREAGCTLADLAPARIVETTLQELNRDGGRIVPLAYVNTSSAVKAICGRYGGSVCTSANAETMLRWALEQGDGVLFLPDKNLALNIADRIGIPENRRDFLLHPGGEQTGVVYIWPGICDVHTAFRTEAIREIRESDSKARVIVHPECAPEVVRAADASGSTSQIIAYVEASPPGSRIYVGTESNLVQRLKRRFAEEKSVLPLKSCDCPFMAQVTEERLAGLLEAISGGGAPRVEVASREASWAREAVNRMLQVCS